MARLARRRHSGHSGGRKRHPLLVAGAVVGAVGLAYLLFEKKASAATNTTNVNGATVPSGAGNNLPSGGGPTVNTGDSAIGDSGSDAAAGSDSADPTGGALTNDSTGN